MAAEASSLEVGREAALVAAIADCYDDPERFVNIAFPWGKAGTILAEETGPDEWQTDFLRLLGAEVRRHLSIEESLRTAIRMAVASGHGVGKTALVAWIILWFMSTRPFPEIVVTANTKTQLSTKTWRELAKWHGIAENKYWFEWTATQFKLLARPDLWYASAIPWSKSNPQAFAGTHEKHVLMLFDEASNIEDIIWETAEGAMTTAGAMWLVFGNPMRNTGRFRECWTRFRKRWITFQVDARRAKKAIKKQIAEWIEDYGIDSDFVRSRVLGEFPRSGPMQMIGVDLVDGAVVREILWKHVPETTPKLMGIDVARGGDNETVFIFRRGPKMMPDIFRYRINDLMKVAAYAAEKIKAYQPDVVFVDATGMGSGVFDRLVQLGYDNVVAVFSGNRGDVMEDKVYYNPRIEMWARLKAWLKYGDIPNDRQLREDLIAPEYFFDTNQLMRLEPKEDLLERGIPSPDTADALALTFAQIVPMKIGLESRQDSGSSVEPDVV